MNNASKRASSDAKLQLTNGYSPRFDQISRLLGFAAGWAQTGRIPKADLAKATGLAENQIKNLASLATGLGLLRPVVYKPTPLAALILEHDRFFDDLGTLWLCHYNLSADPRHVIWNRMTNTVLPAASASVTAATVAGQFDDLREQFTEKSVAKHVPKELRAFFRAYTDYRFSLLKYLVAADGGYRLAERSATVPDEVLLALALNYRDRAWPGSTGLEIPDLCHGENSPGRLLNLAEASLRDSLESLHRRGLVGIESRANLDQIRFRPDLSSLDVLAGYYQRKSQGEGG